MPTLDSGTALLATENLTRHFKGIKALDGVSVRATSGEILGIIGPNGAGKTTLFNCIAGAYPPTAGRVFFKSQDISKLPAHQRCRQGIGRTFQLIQPFGSLTVLENVMVAASAQGLSLNEARERAAVIVNAVGLGPIACKPASEVNAVEGKRLELARALGTNPTLILLDEIFSGLSADEVHDLVSIVADLPSQGLTVLLIEHNVAAIRSVSQRVVAMDAGKVVSEGTPEQVLSDPHVVESYLGQRARA